jgi:hypothetical protein
MGRGTRFRVPTAVAVAVVAALTPVVLTAPASALSTPTPWDGSDPFKCTVQDAGFGTTVPDPSADPYCVHFDKTNQNIAQLGIVQFLLEEPARTAAAVPKCFYFQEDHWRGSVSQGDGTAIYNFEGHYFFNKATGDGGVWVTDFTVNGQTFDPASLPGFPPQYGQDFGPGTGGFISHNDVPADPSCASLARSSSSSVYAHSSRPRCLPDVGPVTRRALGPVAIGAGENSVRAELGPPMLVKRGFLRYCVSGGGLLAVGQPGDRSGNLGAGGRAATVILFTTARGFLLRGRAGHVVTVGSKLRSVRLALANARPIARLGPTRVLRTGRTILIGERRGRVSFLAVYSSKAISTKRKLSDFLERAT